MKKFDTYESKHSDNGRAAEAIAGTALLVIDVQNGLFHKSTPIYKAEVLLRNINTLTERAHHAGVPVFFVQHNDKRALVSETEDWQLHPQLHPLASDTIIHKRHPNAFEETNLVAELKARNVQRVVVSGLVTHGCVRATCVAAQEMGYPVTLVKDAHSSYNKDAAKLIDEWNQTMSERGVQVKSTEEIAF